MALMDLEKAFDFVPQNMLGLRVNARKTKVMICGTDMDLLQSSFEITFTVCLTGSSW